MKLLRLYVDNPISLYEIRNKLNDLLPIKIQSVLIQNMSCIKIGSILFRCEDNCKDISFSTYFDEKIDYENDTHLLSLVNHIKSVML